jgi:hypothetical protein
MALALCGLGLLWAERRAEVSPVAHGETLAKESGCFACHSRAESERRVDFRQISLGVWKPKTIPTLTENGIDQTEILKDWIANGVPAGEAAKHRQLFIQMPAYRSFLKPGEIEDICAWILSEGIRISQAGTTAPTAATPDLATPMANLTGDQLMIAGDRLARAQGCYQCHGELGQGGADNLASFKGYMPGFFGADFAELTHNLDRAEIIHWIDTGRGRAIEAGLTGGIASYFLDHQAIKMPAYHSRLTASETNLLADFLVLLNKEGPLSAKRLESLLRLLTENSPDKT